MKVSNWNTIEHKKQRPKPAPNPFPWFSLIALVSVFSFWCVVAYVAFHFISKYW